MKHIKTEKIVRKAQKYISVMAAVMLMLMMSAVTVFATSGSTDLGQPSNVDTSSMGTMGSVVWWIVRIVILAVGAIPGLINVVKGISDQDDRQRNIGLATLIIAIGVVAATFAVQGIIGF